MLSVGERVHLDYDTSKVWTITAARRSDGFANWFLYKLAGWPNPDEEIPSRRITGIVTE